MKEVIAMNGALTMLEKKAFEVALAGSAPWRKSLCRQVSRLRVTSRRYTGFGFYTDFECSGCVAGPDLPPSDSPDSVPVAWAAHPQVEDGGEGAITFNVFVRNGVISCLEGASTSSWPVTEELIVFM